MWVANRLAYRIESWTTSGQRTRVLTRHVEWFPSSTIPPTASPQVAPQQPTIRGIHDSGDGYLWVYISVADRAWKPERMRSSPVPNMFVPNYVLDRFLDTVVEVIDLRRMVVVASTRDDRTLVPIPGGFVANYQEDDLGNPIYFVFRPHLSGTYPNPR